jgi:hypothetical protein
VKKLGTVFKFFCATAKTKKRQSNIGLLKEKDEMSKITFPDTLMGCVAGRAARIHIRSARPPAVDFAHGHSRQFEGATKPA